MSKAATASLSKHWPLVAKALLKSKAVEGAAAKFKKPGEHALQGRAILDFNCILKKGQAGETHTPYKPDWALIIAYLFYHRGATWPIPVDCETAAIVLQNALHDAEDGHDHVPEDYTAHIRAALDKFIKQKTADGDPVPKEGPTSVVGTVELVDFKEAA
jgi:hypothetical protein